MGRWVIWCFNLVSCMWFLFFLMVWIFLSNLKLLLMFLLLGGCIKGNVVILFNFNVNICRIIDVKLVCRIFGLVKVGCFK